MSHPIAPLAVLHQIHGRESGAYDAASAFIALLEIPLAQWRADVIRLIKSKRTEPEIIFAINEVLYRRRIIRWISKVRSGQGVKLKDEGYWEVDSLPPFQIELMTFYEDKERFFLLEQIERTDRETDDINDTARRILAFWHDIPL